MAERRRQEEIVRLVLELSKTLVSHYPARLAALPLTSASDAAAPVGRPAADERGGRQAPLRPLQRDRDRRPSRRARSHRKAASDKRPAGGAPRTGGRGAAAP